MSDFDDPLVATFEAILREDILDPNRRRTVALMIHAHAKTAMVHSLRDKFDPYLGLNAVKPTVEEALTAMRGAIVRLAGFDRDDPDRWNMNRALWKKREGSDSVGSGVGDDRDDQRDSGAPGR